MGKPQNGKKNGAQGMSPAKAIQQGQVKKNKQEKFKKTPVGKIQVINGKSNGNAAIDKKQNNGSPAKKQQFTPSPKKNNNNNKKNNNKNQKKSPVQPEVKNVKAVEEKDDDDSEISDVDEGIPPIQEDVSMDDDDSDSDDEIADTPDIFGQSLAEDTDDTDFGDDDTEASLKNGKKMGVKPFKGVKSEVNDLNTSGTSSANSSIVTEDDEDDDDDSEDEEDSKSGLKALELLVGDSLLDSENDEDFEEDDEDDDEDDDDISDDGEDLELNQSATSIVEEKNGKPVLLSTEQKAELDNKTIFIGNVPIAVDEKKIRATFKSYGPIESIRIRGIIPESPKVSKKVAAITKKFHPKATAKCVFVVFKDVESADKALALNGTQLDGNYLRVDKVNASRSIDPKKAVFIGNLKFDIEDNNLWEMFNKCGKIDWVRTVRDRITGCCRGMAYINFIKEDSVALALNLNGQLLNERELRVLPYKVMDKKPKHEAGKKRARSADSTGSPSKKAKRDEAVAIHNSKNAQKRKEGQQNKRSQGQQKRANVNATVNANGNGKTQASPKGKGTFQGQKADNKKPFKKGANKFDKQKKNMAAKLTAKPNKPVKN